MKEVIKITIEGATGTGKSSLACAINELLTRYGIECSLGGMDVRPADEKD